MVLGTFYFILFNSIYFILKCNNIFKLYKIYILRTLFYYCFSQKCQFTEVKWIANNISCLSLKIQLFISPSINYHFASAIIACVHFLQAIKCGLTGLWLNIGYFNFLLYETKSITVFLRPIERVFNVLWPIKRFISGLNSHVSCCVCVWAVEGKSTDSHALFCFTLC